MPLIVPFDQLVQSKELCDQRIGVLFDIVIVIFKNTPQKLILSVVDSLEGILTVGRVVEERTAFALTGQGSHRTDLPHHQRCHQLVWTDRVYVVFVVDFEYLTDVVESVRSVVSERKNRRVVILILIPKFPGNQFKTVLQPKIFGLFADDFLKPFDAPDCHLYADHHVEHQVPILVANEHHISFIVADALMDISRCVL